GSLKVECTAYWVIFFGAFGIRLNFFVGIMGNGGCNSLFCFAYFSVFEADGRLCFQFVGGVPRLCEICAQFHRETSGMRRPKKFFGICSYPIFKSAVERILCFI